MNHFVIFVMNFLSLLNTTTVTSLFTLGHFDRNSLETYEEVSSERNDIDVFGNLTFRFSCEGRPSGFYADVDYNCRIFHVCDNSGDGFPIICANNTIFDQRQRICTDEENIDCQHAYEWYYLNELTYPTEIAGNNESKMINDEEDVVPSVLPLMFNVPAIACALMILPLVSFVLLLRQSSIFRLAQRVELAKKMKEKKKCTRKTFDVVVQNNLESILVRA